MKKALYAAASVALFFSIAPLALADISYDFNAPTDPQPQFGFYCNPYTESFAAGGYYTPITSQNVCHFVLTAQQTGSPDIFIATYKGIPGNATLESFDYGSLPPASIITSAPDSFDGVQGDSFFSVAMGYSNFNNVLSENNFLTTGGADPGFPYASVQWNWGTPPSITVTANNQTINAGDSIPTLTATISGFVNGDTLATADITGAPSCTTSATNASPAGDYPITCTQGTLASPGSHYSFTNFVPGTLHIQASQVQTTASQTITVTGHAPASATYSSSFNVAATASSNLPVAITASGSCSGSGSGSATVTMMSGTGSCTVNYNQAGNASFNPAPQVTESTTANKANAVIVVTPYAATFDGSAHTAQGTATGVESPTPADLSGLLTLSGTTHTNAGTYSDAWSFAGNGNYNAANGTISDSITKAGSVTTVSCPASVVYTGSAQTPCTASVVGAGGLSLTPTPTYANNTNVGTANASYTFAGDANHTGSTDSKNFSITKATPVCTITPYTVTYDGAAHSATGSCQGVGTDGTLGGLDLSATTHTAAGDYPSDAWSFTDTTGNYTNKSGTVHDSIAKANQTITPTLFSNTTVIVGASSTLSASASSGLPVSYSVSGPCAISGSTLTYSAIGTCTLTTSQGGSANFNPASVTQTITIDYRWDGFLQPINDTAHQIGENLSVFKAGSTVPVKLQLKDINGNVLQAAVAPQWLAPVQGSVMSSAVDELDYTDPGTTGTSFSWNGTQYQYNWSTKGLAAGYWYHVYVRADDGEIFTVTIGLR